MERGSRRSLGAGSPSQQELWGSRGAPSQGPFSFLCIMTPSALGHSFNRYSSRSHVTGVILVIWGYGSE